MLQIYNSLTRKKEIFESIQKGKVNLYVCGMTVYDYCHMGHARVLVAFDIVTRYLRYRGYQVKYVRNITDIDDKIILRANENGEKIETLTDRFIAAMHEDEKTLSILPPDIEPRATLFMRQMIEMIEALLKKDFAYIAENGDVYYRVSQFAKYGALAHKDLEGLRAGARVEINDVKKDPLDFVLWKLAKPNEPSWDSPWGRGRPGWHIECSAMSTHCLGDHFDIHGGGFDLQFPHHENEIAQSEAATSEPFVNTWMHVGFLQINKEKMSKSLGNFFTIRDVLKNYPAEVVRYFLTASHYRSPLNYSTENLEMARSALERLYGAVRDLPQRDPVQDSEFEKKFIEVMDDDFNTPEALAVLFELVREINRLKETDEKQAAEHAALLKKLCGVLGILQQSADSFLQDNLSEEERKKIEALVKQRKIAREQKNWVEADRIRDELKAMGIEVEDGANKSSWKRI